MPSATRKTVTLQDVARAAGIAKSTASMALNGNATISPATREAVLRAAAELGFAPNVHARRLNGRSENIVGLLCADIELSGGARKLRTIQHLLTERGFDAPAYLGTSDRTVLSAVMNNLRQQRPGAVLCDTALLSPDIVAELQRYRRDGGVVVCHDREVCEIDCDRVVFDREENTYLATRHLLELGHRRVGFYNNGAPATAEPRWPGFRRAMEEFGATIREEWLFSGIYEEGGAQMAHGFLTLREWPTALCIVNDYASTAFVATLHRISDMRVPRDVSIVSSANLPIAAHGPVPLTTMTYPYETIARKAVDLLTERLAAPGDSPPRRVVVGSELVRRESAIPLFAG